MKKKNLTTPKRHLFLGVCLLALLSARCSSDDEPKVETGNGKINGHEYVDLGLPSGTMWATCNVGAKTPTDYGHYYAWGETETKSLYPWSDYMCGEEDCGTSKDPLQDYVNKGQSIAGTEHDVAHVKWGGTWQMPTEEQLEELFDSTYCTTEWTANYNDTKVAGYIITSRVKGYEGNSIFLPAAGYRYDSSLDGEGIGGSYWSATPGSSGANVVCSLYFYSGYIGEYYDERYVGQLVRPVAKRQGAQPLVSKENGIERNMTSSVVVR